MKKILTLCLLLLVFFSMGVNAKEKVTLYFFYGEGCPHCAEEERELIKELEKDKSVRIVKLESWSHKKNYDLLTKVVEAYGCSEGVPTNIIGDTAIVGYSDANNYKIKRAIKYYKTHKYIDEIKRLKAGKKVEIDDKFSSEEATTDNENIISMPFFGKINLKRLSLSTAAIVVGLIDGFNPCAMWVLLFLLTTLIGMKDKKKMIILGFIFLFTSALVYFLIMFSWLNIVVSVSTSIIFRTIIAIAALLAGIYNIYSFIKALKSDDGCEVVSEEKRKTIFSRIKRIVHEKSFLLAILGIMALAISVNIVDLLCSAGLPVIFSELLAINDVSGTRAILYDLLYILFFMFDDIAVFLIAIKTMDIVGISTKYNKYSHLVGGLIMLLIGVLLLFKPGWLMFNFK